MATSGNFAPTVCALRETLGENLLFDKPSEQQSGVDAAVNVPVVN